MCLIFLSSLMYTLDYFTNPHETYFLVEIELRTRKDLTLLILNEHL